jgi:hypothetical protein
MAAKLPGRVLSANVGLGSDAGWLRFDWFRHGIYSAAGDDAAAGADGAAFAAAALRADFVT